MSTNINIGMISLGCPKNLSDAEIMLKLLKEDGFNIVNDTKIAHIVIVNTCGFIESAKAESIEAILKATNKLLSPQLKGVIVTGCLAERYNNQVMTEIPECSAVIGIGANRNICDVIKQVLNGKKIKSFPPKSELLLDYDRVISTPGHYAYLRIADGCNNRCSYCAIPFIRGPFVSRPQISIINEAKSLSEKGVKEIILIAQDTTRYGLDLYDELRLPSLLSELVSIDNLKWIRLLYCYPDRITDELLNIMAENPHKILPYFDIPLQHCNKDILKSMNRSGNFDELTKLVSKIRKKLPGCIIRTTFITGYPGETNEQFSELCDFIKLNKFERLGCFAYSPEEDTPAALMPNQLDNDEKNRRLDIIMREQSLISRKFNESLINKTFEVLLEGFNSELQMYYGRSYMDCASIDCCVYFKASDERAQALNTGTFTDVLITSCDDYDLFGQAL